jgi:hypothetical protein
MVAPWWATIAECDQLRALGLGALVHSHGEHVRDDYAGRMRTIYPEAITLSSAPIYTRICQRIVEAISEHYHADVRLDCGLMVQMLSGASHERHADAELEDGSPNHTAHRTHVGLLYLNDHGMDHGGGVLEVAGREIPAAKGLLACFPSTHEYMHSVSPVTRGERWSLNVWTMR